MKKKRVWMIVALVLVAIAATGMVLKGRGAKPMEVQTAKVDLQKIVQKISATGKIQPKTQVKISADVSAKITKLEVVEGQWVEKGTLLVELDRERYLAAVESAEASVHSAEANAHLVKQNVDRSQKEYERSKQLLADGVESQAAYDAKEAEFQVESARYKSAMDQAEQAKGALKQSRDDLSKTRIYAPMSGTISELNKERGEMALGSQFQADVILVIADLREMEAQVNVDENDIASIAIGQPADIEVDAMLDSVLHGTVYEISNSANSAGGGTQDQKTEFEVKIAITNPPKSLRPGMTASADVITKTKDNALSVPLQSVAVRTVDQLKKKGEKRADAETHYKADKDGFVEIVFCIENGKAVAKQVKTGIQSENLIEVVEGLKQGDEIVSGSYRAISKDLENGAGVTVNNQAHGKPERAQAG